MTVNPSDAYYLCFTLDTDEDAAAARYQQKIGAPPEQIIEARGLLWLGPIDDGRVRENATSSNVTY